MPSLPIGAQLYTVRELIKTDFAVTIRAIAKIGYEGVEIGRFPTAYAQRDAKKLFDDLGLKICGVHIAVDELENDLPRVVAEQQELGNKNIVLSWIAEDRRKNGEDWRAFAKTCNAIGTALKKSNMSFAFHNHSFEFQMFDGKTGMEIFLEHTDPNVVRLEPDVYWLQHGGEEPAKFLERNRDRILLMHLKDMAAGEDKKFAPVGTGVLDFKAILRKAQDVGALWGIVEQDQCYETPPLEAMKISYENLRKIAG
ncbi:MAG: sugar phosphate isomerase/epimerase [Anaerolineae bacterium]|nr:sugar phosphate isomerase/epimerase [Phycisphaerae bacterium]